MKKGNWLLILFLIMVIGALAYFLGRKSGNVTVQNIATNDVIIKQIAELAGLEVQGTATIKHTNILNDGSFTDALKKVFVENTINISVPYIAKYGVDLQQQRVDIRQKNQTVTIHLPEPKLMSYELRMDKINASSKEGLLLTQNHDAYNAVQQSLYTKTRKELEGDATHISQAKEKIITILKQYYQPVGYKVNVSFGNETAIQNILKLD